MAIVQLPLPIAANTGVIPNIKTMTTTDNYATITTAAYLNQYNLTGYPVSSEDIIFINYDFDATLRTGTFAIFTVSVSSLGVITLTEYNQSNGAIISGSVTPGHLAVFGATENTLVDAPFVPSDPTETLISSVTTATVAGDFAVYADTAGSLKSGPYTPSDASAQNVAMVSQPSTSGNFAVYSDTSGTLANGSFAPAAVQLKAQIIANKANIGGTGGGPTDVAVVGLTASSVVVAAISTSSTSAAVVGCFAGTDKFTVTFSADPGVVCILSYIAFIATQ